jgi:hypothetical protein
VLGFALSWLFAAATLPAASVTVTRGSGAEGCRDANVIAQRVDSILHRQALVSGEEPPRGIDIQVQFTRTKEGMFVATVRTSGLKAGERVLRDRSATCDALSEAVSVGIALLLDSAAHDDGEAAPTKASPPAPHHETTPPVDSAPAASRTGPSTRQVRGRLGLVVGGGYGLAGSPLLVGSQLGFAAGGLRVELGLLASLPSSSSYRAGEVKTSLLFANARVCYLLGPSVRLGPCVGFGLGRVRGEGNGFDEAFRTDLLWTAGGLGLIAEAPLLRGLSAGLAATLWVPLRRQTFSVENAGIAWESKAVAGVLSAALNVELF